MTTGTLSGTGSYGRSTVEPRERTMRLRLGRVGLGTAGVVAVLAAAWGGIVPYVGPLFGFSADGAGSWHWSLAHTLLFLVPGALGVLLGLFVVAESRGVVIGKGRLSLAMGGVLLILCGAWFAIGSYAWPVLMNTGNYFSNASHLRFLTYELGYSVGVGLVLVMCGAFVAGWASRHNPGSAVIADAAPVAEPGVVEPGTAEPMRVEPTRGEPMRAEPMRGEPMRGEPMRAESSTAEPNRAQTTAEPEAGI